MTDLSANIEINTDKDLVILKGSWDLHGISTLAAKYLNISWPTHRTLTLDGTQITKMDSAGAWLLHQCKNILTQHENTIKTYDFRDVHKEMIALVEQEAASHPPEKPPAQPAFDPLYQLGKGTVKRIKEGYNFLSLTGELTLYILKAFKQLRLFQFPNTCNAIYHCGYRALPILALLSFLIGVVLAYQMGLQLETYGANIFIVYLSGMAVLREFGPLLTAIIVAGRTSSSFTAEIGTMKVNEEIDALLTMGISPTQRLVLPKTVGLIIVFPLLIFWADAFGLFGSMVMSKWMLGINYPDFFARMKSDVGVSHYYIGLSKAPFFAAIIALVGCYQGFTVSLSADSVGFQTTKSVVQAIFLIIIADAIFSVLFSWAGL